MLPANRSDWLWLVTVCAVLTLAFTYPIWTAPHRLLNDNMDGRLVTWILAWGAHAATTAPTTLFDANIFYPRSNAFALSENLLGSMPLAAPFALAGLPVLGYNVVLLLSFFLFGLTTALWVRYLTGNLAAGLVAGVAATFAPSRLGQLPHLQLLVAQWIPLSLLLVTRYADTGRARHLAGASCLLALQYWAGIQITLIFAPLVALYALVMIRWRRQPLEHVRTGVHLAAAAALFVALVLPISLPYLAAAEEGMTRGLSDRGSAQPKNYLSPAASNRMPHMQVLRRFRGHESDHFAGVTVWAVVAATSLSLLGTARRQRREPPPHPAVRALRFGVLAAAAAYVGTLIAAFTGDSGWLISKLAPLAPAVVLCLGISVLPLAERPTSSRRTVWVFWLLLALAAIGYLLSHGPTVQAWAAELGAGPFRLLYELRPYQSMRATGRFGLATSLCLSAALGVAVAMATRRWSRLRYLAPVVLVLVVVEYWAAPLRTYDSTLRDEEAYAALAELPGTGAVLHVPVISHGDGATEYMLGSTRHWRPLVNGYSGFRPAFVRELDGVEPFSAAFFDLVEAEAAVEYVLLHGHKMDTETFRSLRAAAKASPYLKRVGAYGTTLVYRWRPQTRSGERLSRRLAWSSASGKPVTARVRGTRRRPFDVELLWGNRIVSRTAVDRHRLSLGGPPPTAADRNSDGSVTLTLRSVPDARWDRPLGNTGASVRADILVDAQTNRLGVAVNELWQVVERVQTGILCVVLSADGRYVRAAQRFGADQVGIVSAAAYVDALAPGTIVAVAFLPGPRVAGRTADAMSTMLRGLGGRVLTDRPESDRYVLLGARGAPPGTALEEHARGRAAVRAGPRKVRSPTFKMRWAHPPP